MALQLINTVAVITVTHRLLTRAPLIADTNSPSNRKPVEDSSADTGFAEPLIQSEAATSSGVPPQIIITSEEDDSSDNDVTFSEPTTDCLTPNGDTPHGTKGESLVSAGDFPFTDEDSPLTAGDSPPIAGDSPEEQEKACHLSDSLQEQLKLDLRELSSGGGNSAYSETEGEISPVTVINHEATRERGCLRFITTTLITTTVITLLIICALYIVFESELNSLELSRFRTLDEVQAFEEGYYQPIRARIITYWRQLVE